MVEDQASNSPMESEVSPTPQNERQGTETPQNETNTENEEQ